MPFSLRKRKKSRKSVSSNEEDPQTVESDSKKVDEPGEDAPSKEPKSVDTAKPEQTLEENGTVTPPPTDRPTEEGLNEDSATPEQSGTKAPDNTPEETQPEADAQPEADTQPKAAETQAHSNEDTDKPVENVANAEADSFTSVTPSASPVQTEAKAPEEAFETNCVICKTTVKNPHLLPCMHSVCFSCELSSARRGGTFLYDVMKPAEEEISAVLCPICNEAFPVPKGGFLENTYLARKMTKDELLRKMAADEQQKCEVCEKEDLAEHYCEDCKDFLCPSCTTFHRQFKATKKHIIKAIQEVSLEASIDMKARDIQQKLKCPQHSETIGLYCEQCDTAICSICLTESHSAHPTAVIDEKLSVKHKEMLEEILKVTKEESDQLSPLGLQNDGLAEEIHSELKVTQQAIVRLVEILNDILVQRRDDLNEEAAQIASNKLEPIRKHREAISKVLDQYQHISQLVEAILRDGTPEDVAVAKSFVISRRRKLKVFLDAASEPQRETTAITLRTLGNIDSISQALAGVGYVCAGSSTEYSKLHLPYPSTPAISLEQEEDLVVQVTMKDLLDNPYPRGGEQVTAVLKAGKPTVADGEQFNGSVQDNDNGTYTIHFQKYKPGENQIYVKLYGQNFLCCPEKVILTVKDIHMISENSSAISCPDSAGLYRAVAIGANGMLAITDSEKRRVCILKPDGEVVKTFGNKGSRDGMFKNKMTGVAFDKEGFLYVTDDDNNRVQKFNVETGQVHNVISGHGAKGSKLDRPRGIAIHPTEQTIFLSEFDYHRISVFQSSGHFSHSFGKKGNGPGKLKHPVALAIGPNGDLYVVDSGNSRIQVFTTEGDYVRSFGQKKASVDLNQPWGICVTPEGYVLVSERSGNSIAVFKNDGQFLFEFGSKGEDAGQFDQPCGLATDGEGQVFVTDAINRRVQIFSYVHN